MWVWSWTSVSQDQKANSRRTWGLEIILLLDMECFQNTEMMERDKQPKSDKSSPGMLPTMKTNNWAVSPGVLFHALAMEKPYCERVRGWMEICLLECIVHTFCPPISTDWVGINYVQFLLPSILGLKKDSSLLTHLFFLISFYFYYYHVYFW